MKYLIPSIILFLSLVVGRIHAQETYIPHTPTGCPYGDSIPVDSVKCVPPQQYTNAPVGTPDEPIQPTSGK